MSNISDKEQLVQKIEIENQYLNSQFLDERNVTYTIQSALGLEREVVVEYPINGYELVATDGVKLLGAYNGSHRFSLTAPPSGAVRTLKLTRTSIRIETLNSISSDRLGKLLLRNDWSATDKEVLQKILILEQNVTAASRKLSTENTQLANIKSERQRLIDLLKQLPEKSASYQRQLAELDQIDLVELQKQQTVQTLETELKGVRLAKDTFIEGLAAKQ